jgi:hypothetical protein
MVLMVLLFDLSLQPSAHRLWEWDSRRRQIGRWGSQGFRERGPPWPFWLVASRDWMEVAWSEGGTGVLGVASSSQIGGSGSSIRHGSKSMPGVLFLHRPVDG